MPVTKGIREYFRDHYFCTKKSMLEKPENCTDDKVYAL